MLINGDVTDSSAEKRIQALCCYPERSVACGGPHVVLSQADTTPKLPVL
jgi:hypothetical protein